MVSWEYDPADGLRQQSRGPSRSGPLYDFEYRYYQFYGNTLVATAVAAFGHWPPSSLLPVHPRWLSVPLLLGMLALFYVASHDALRKYHERLTVLHTAVLERSLQKAAIGQLEDLADIQGDFRWPIVGIAQRQHALVF